MIHRSEPEDALRHAINAAELYMKAAGATRVPAERQRLRNKFNEVAALGEYLKAPITGSLILPRQARGVTRRETLVLLRSSKLHRNNFLPWRESHSSSDVFRLKSGEQSYRYVRCF